MAAEVTIVIRFERTPTDDALRRLVEDEYEDAIILEIETEAV